VSSVPLVDLNAQHRQVADEVQQGFARVLGRASFILDEEVAAFEREFARFSAVEHCVGVANGTDALELVLRALGIGAGDEVVVPTNSFIATALAVSRAGATPVLVDCDPVSHLIDVGMVARRIGRSTRAIVPVHLYGQIAPMEELEKVASDAGLALIEDAAQAHGATRHGRTAGGLGLAAGTSFYPAKNLGAYGDGGAVLTRSEEIARKIRALRNYGGETKYEHPETGFNSRLDSLQAVVLRAKLGHLAEWNDARRAAARRYDELLAGVESVRRPATLPGNEHVWHLYVVRVPGRDRVLAELHAAGIGAGIHYPVPIHLQGAFRQLGHRRGDFPAAERAAGEVLSLPLFPGITAAQQERVVAALTKALA
jgi:dTDP-4-amino-4,6-dideoxygalactose transaminase